MSSKLWPLMPVYREWCTSRFWYIIVNMVPPCTFISTLIFYVWGHITNYWAWSLNLIIFIVWKWNLLFLIGWYVVIMSSNTRIIIWWLICFGKLCGIIGMYVLTCRPLEYEIRKFLIKYLLQFFCFKLMRWLLLPHSLCIW